jgi:hypothetical protein
MSFSGMSTASFSAILQFIYNGDLTITPSIVKDLSRIAEWFGVEELNTEIKEYYISLSSDDCLTILHERKLSWVDPMFDIILMPVVRDFRNIVKTPKFLELPYNTVSEILSSDVLGVERETEVLPRLGYNTIPATGSIFYSMSWRVFDFPRWKILNCLSF